MKIERTDGHIVLSLTPGEARAMASAVTYAHEDKMQTAYFEYIGRPPAEILGLHRVAASMRRIQNLACTIDHGTPCPAGKG